jgi:hypothetical protein
MRRRPLFHVVALAVLLCGLLAVYLLGRLTPYQEEVKQGPAPEAIANPYLAAEHFLRQRGLQVQRADGLEILPSLPSAGQTLLLLGDRNRITPRQTQRLLEWASRGGHLLVVAERLYDEDKGESGDLLLDQLGIQQFRSQDLEKDAEAAKTDEPEAKEEEEPVEADAYPALTKLYLENEEAPAYIGFDTDFHLFDSQNRAQSWANSAKTTHMLQLQYGDGLISVVTDAWIWQNRHIEDYDNAWLLWYLTQDSAVTLLYRADRDNLASLLAEYFPEALVALALLLVLGLWHVGQRSGPLQPLAAPARRQLQEHLRGSADFLLRRGGQRSLLQDLQQDIQRRARRRHPGFERLGVAEQWQILGRLSRLPSGHVSQAMRPVPDKRLSAADFTRQVAHLQTLRNSL